MSEEADISIRKKTKKERARPWFIASFVFGLLAFFSIEGILYLWYKAEPLGWFIYLNIILFILLFILTSVATAFTGTDIKDD